jgi:hypothetical protein
VVAAAILVLGECVQARGVPVVEGEYAVVVRFVVGVVDIVVEVSGQRPLLAEPSTFPR